MLGLDFVVWYLDAQGQSDLAARHPNEALQALAKSLVGFRVRVRDLKDGVWDDRSFLGRRNRPGAVGVEGFNGELAKQVEVVIRQGGVKDGVYLIVHYVTNVLSYEAVD